jgi:N-acetylneuraminic acid mutarotase
MKTHICKILPPPIILMAMFHLVSILFCQVLAGQNTWTQKTNYPGGAIYFGSSFVINGEGYVGKGYSGSDFWKFNPQTNQWTAIADFPPDPYQIRTFSVGSYGYVIAYLDNAGIWETQVWQYNPLGDQWVKKNNFPGPGRADALALSIGDYGYYGLGNVGSPYNTDFWKYSPVDDLWIRVSDMPCGSRAAAVFSIDNKGYICCGENNFSGSFSNDVWMYNPVLDSWTQNNDFSGGGRIFPTGFSIGSKGFLGTGVKIATGFGSGYSRDFWEYDPITDTWTQRADLGGPTRSGAVGFNLGDKGYIATGYDGYMNVTPWDDLWEYSPVTTGFPETNSFAFRIFPNPATNMITIRSNSPKLVNCKIFNNFGILVLRKEIELKEVFNVDISLLNNGLYILEISDEKFVFREKLLIEK